MSFRASIPAVISGFGSISHGLALLVCSNVALALDLSAVARLFGSVRAGSAVKGLSGRAIVLVEAAEGLGRGAVVLVDIVFQLDVRRGGRRVGGQIDVHGCHRDHADLLEGLFSNGQLMLRLGEIRRRTYLANGSEW